MIKFNYRHSIQTMNKQLVKKGMKIGFFMQSGQPTYQITDKNGVCGFYYSAKDVAEFATKVANQ